MSQKMKPIPNLWHILPLIFCQILHCNCDNASSNNTAIVSNITTLSPDNVTVTLNTSTAVIPAYHHLPNKCEWYQRRMSSDGEQLVCVNRTKCHPGYEYHPYLVQEDHDWNCQSCRSHNFQDKTGYYRCKPCKVTYCHLSSKRFLIRRCSRKSDGYCSQCQRYKFKDRKTGGCHTCSPCCSLKGEKTSEKQTDCLNHTPGTLGNRMCFPDKRCQAMVVLVPTRKIPQTVTQRINSFSTMSTRQKGWTIIFGATVGTIIFFAFVALISIGCYKWRRKYKKFMNIGGDDQKSHCGSRHGSLCRLPTTDQSHQVHITGIGNVEYRKLVQQSSLTENNTNNRTPDRLEEDTREMYVRKLADFDNNARENEQGSLLD